MWQEENQRLVIEKLSEMLSATDNTYAEKLTTMFDEAGRIFISGAGRSKLVGNFLGMRLMHCDYDVAIVGEIVTPSVNRGDLLIVISGSGETEQLIAFTKKAKEIEPCPSVDTITSKPFGQRYAPTSKFTHPQPKSNLPRTSTPSKGKASSAF